MSQHDAPQRLMAATAPGLLFQRSVDEPDRTAYRAKRLGLYRARSWHDYATQVGRVAVALRGLELAAGERVALIGDCCEALVWCDIAAQAAGGIPYGIYPTASTRDLEHLLRDGGAAICVCENQQYVDRVVALADRLPALRWVIVTDMSAMFAYRHPRLRKLDELIEATTKQTGLDALAALTRDRDPASPAFIAYTAGTTGQPKGIIVSHAAHLAAASRLIEHYPVLRHAPRMVAHLPLAHPLGRAVAVTLPLISAALPHFGEPDEDVVAVAREVRPTVLVMHPRQLKKIAARIAVGMANSSPLKRAVYRAALAHGRRFAEQRWSKRATTSASLRNRLLRALAFRPILAKLGFDQLRLLICAGAALPHETMALWQSYGVNTVEVYAPAEAAGGIATGQRDAFPRPGNVGAAPQGMRVEIAADGAIVLDGQHRTGDTAAWSDSALRITGRDGVQPPTHAALETALGGSSYIAEAVVLTRASGGLTAVIELEFDTLSQWAAENALDSAGYSALASHDAVRSLIAAAIERAHATVGAKERIEELHILPRPLDHDLDDPALTATRTVRRHELAARYGTRASPINPADRSETADA